MSGADISALATAITGVIGAVTALVIAINHVLHHDAPPADSEPARSDGGGQNTQR